MVELKGKQLLVATILTLLAIGSLGYNALPKAYCDLEDKTVSYIHMSESHKTVTKVLPDGDSWSIIDDRCQKGTEIGEWVPINTESIKVETKCNPIVIAYTDNGKFFCRDIGTPDQECIKDGTLEVI